LKVDSTNNRVGVLNASPAVSLDAGSATDAFHVPVGTTAQRPSGAAGHFRYNTTLEQFEGYTDDWGQIGGGGGANAFATDSYTGNGSTTAYALSQVVVSEDNLLVFIEGVFQQQDAYSIATAGGTTTLTFSAAPANGNDILIYSVVSAISGTNLNSDTMTGDGSDTTLTLSLAPVNENNTQVYIDGVYQNKDTYSISGTTLTFSAAPPNGSAVEVMTMNQLDINTPTDGSVTPAKIASGDFYFDTNTLYIDATNNLVGIGNSSPSSYSSSARQLVVGSGSGSNGITITSATNGSSAIFFADGTSSGQQYDCFISANHTDSALLFGTGSTGATDMTITSAGRVGIGTSAPSKPLQITDATADRTGGVKISSYLPTLEMDDISGGGTSFILQQDGTSTLFKHDANERMRIDSNGCLLRNTTSSTVNSSGGEIIVLNDGNRAAINVATDSTSSRTGIVFTNPNGTVGSISMSGSGISIVQSSDYRLKENVVAMSGATDRLKQLKPSRFNFIADADTTVDGFLAHEVQDVVPEAITGTKDAVDADGNPDYQGIDQSKLVPLLVATIQELEARLTALENN